MKVTAADIARLLAGTPPRSVPPLVFAVACRSAYMPVFLVQLLAGFVIFGLVMMLVEAPWGFWDEWRLNHRPAATVEGKIDALLGHESVRDNKRFLVYDFSFALADGRRIHGRCWGPEKVWTPGMTVSVRHLLADPGVACVDGGTVTSPFASWGGPVVFFPYLSGILLIIVVRSRRRLRWLLRHGCVAEATILAVAENMDEDHLAYPTIEFAVPGLNGGRSGQHRVSVKVYRFVVERAGPGRSLYILYNPEDPDQYTFPEFWIGRG